MNLKTQHRWIVVALILIIVFFSSVSVTAYYSGFTSYKSVGSDSSEYLVGNGSSLFLVGDYNSSPSSNPPDMGSNLLFTLLPIEIAGIFIIVLVFYLFIRNRVTVDSDGYETQGMNAPTLVLAIGFIIALILAYMVIYQIIQAINH